jgi:transcriptional regulator of arginine metabolism
MWKTVLLSLLRSGRFGTQAELVAELSRQGFEVNQATVSRALRTHGVRKTNGVYSYSAASSGDVPVHALSVTGGGCLAVLKTDPAFAPMLGQRIDDAHLVGVLGTIAGDDTVFVALQSPGDTQSIRHFLGWVDGH